MRIKILLVIFLGLVISAAAQTYHIDWYVIGSGGGHSQSSNYQVDGTIGQLIVGHSSSPSYQIDAGFWTGVTTGQSGCIYVIGDANNSSTFTGLDVTYSVRFFKGGPHPVYSCECTSGNTWYVSGDVNGSCTFTGLDITYMVRYFKGGPAAIPCPDCPPAGFLAPHPIPEP